MRHINAPGKQLVKDYEKVCLVAYMPTPHDVPTIGVGHTKGVKMGDTCTMGQADLWFSADLNWAENCVADSVKVALNDNQFAALVSFTFNLGCGALLGSTLLRVLNEGMYNLAANQFRAWNKQRNRKTNKLEVLDGLTKRRVKERDLFLCPVST